MCLPQPPPRPSRLPLSLPLVSALLVSCAGSAHAQLPQGGAGRFRPVRVKLGGFFPTSGTVRSQVGSALLSGGISYEYPDRAEDGVTALYGVYIDGAARSGRVTKDVAGIPTDFDTRFGYVAVGASVRKVNAPDDVGAPARSRTYAGMGFGVYFLREKGVQSIDGVDRSYTRDRSSFGAKLFAGVDAGGGVFTELDFTYPGYWDRSGFCFSVGVRF